MSFDGKTYKKISSQNAAEILEKLGVSDEIYGLLRSSGCLSTYCINKDGSLTFKATKAGEVVVDMTGFQKQEINYVTPTGAVIKIYYNMDENSIKSLNILQDGKVFCLDRYFDSDGKYMKMEMHIPGVDIIAVSHYEAI